jgi:hypothetical protein
MGLCSEINVKSYYNLKSDRRIVMAENKNSGIFWHT